MFRIIESNLPNSENDFITAELETVIKASKRHNIELPNLMFRLSARNLKPVKPDSNPFSDFARRQREAQSYKLTFKDSEILIDGGNYPGVLYGVYAALRQKTGVDFSGIYDSDIGFHPVLPSEPMELAPQVPFRGMNGLYPELDKKFIFDFLRYMARNQWNRLMIHVWRWEACQWRQELLEFARLCGVEFHLGGHSMENFFPETLFDEHPEFFGMRNGVRGVRGPVTIPDLNLIIPDAYLQPCYSNPDACDYIARQIVKYIDSHPEINVFVLWPHDGANNFCQCPECLKLTPYDQMVRQARRVLELVPRPIYLEMLAYCALLTPPGEKANLSRTYTIFCPYLRHYEHRFYDPGFSREEQRLGRSYPNPDPVNPDDDRDYGLLLTDWKKYLSKNQGTLGIFAYYQLLFVDAIAHRDRSRYLRWPDPALVADELRRFMSDGMLVYYDCSCPYPNLWPDGRLYSFHSHLLMNPQAPVEELIDRHEQLRLGKARTIINHITDMLDRGDRNFDDVWLEELKRISPDKPVSLWTEYVRLGCHSRQAQIRGDVEAIRNNETAIIRLLEDNSELLNKYCNVPAMVKHATGIIRDFETGIKLKSNILA